MRAQASLSQTGRPPPRALAQQLFPGEQQAGGRDGGAAPDQELQGGDGSGAPELAAAGPGLQNQIGEYNCFLNVIIQCLWHCRSFRGPFCGQLAAARPENLQVRNAFP